MYVDKRLAGIQAVQTLSRLNRGAIRARTRPTSSTSSTSRGRVLEAFKTYYRPPSWSAVTDPNLVFDLRAKLDGSGHYDDLRGGPCRGGGARTRSRSRATWSALEPVADRLLKRYKAAPERLLDCQATGKDDEAAKEAHGTSWMRSILFKGDMGAVPAPLHLPVADLRLRQHRRSRSAPSSTGALLPLLEFGREREGIDVSKVVLTHHNLRRRRQAPLPLSQARSLRLDADHRDRQRQRPGARKRRCSPRSSHKVNDLFEGDLTDDDKLVYVNNVIKGKLLESETLRQQATNNTKEQFANSPDLSER